MQTFTFTLPDSVKLISIQTVRSADGGHEWLLICRKDYLTERGAWISTTFHKRGQWPEVFDNIEEVLDAQHEKEMAIAKVQRTAYHKEKAKEKEELKAVLDDIFNSL